ncbi:hypothetical protein C8A03DRAFT_48165 [Achaetomium macrosporum]|uniref:Uncharacterized protein n=1 Tax=Achaetomium macrosporum TaxID=79813 RepID=A0AAN7H3C6_9PEZI|nr:hypothetical protein C8A03DRAFT_48165 [Achaetomium macrosporum]
MKFHCLIPPLVLATQAQAFRVTFYLAYQCRGARISVSAAIEKEWNDGESNNVAFWRVCNQNLVASADDNCVNFARATRFSIREDWIVPGKHSASSSVAAKAVEARIEASGESSPAREAGDAINSLPLPQLLVPFSPYFDPDIMVEGGFGHGNVSEVFGKIVRWQQLALGISVGVPVDEWDDAIHVKSDAFVPYGDVPFLEARAGYDGIPKEGSRDSHIALAAREEHEKNACETVGGDWVKNADGWAQGVACADRIKALGSTLYDYVKRYPVTCEVVKLGLGAPAEAPGLRTTPS